MMNKHDQLIIRNVLEIMDYNIHGFFFPSYEAYNKFAICAFSNAQQLIDGFTSALTVDQKS